MKSLKPVLYVAAPVLALGVATSACGGFELPKTATPATLPIATVAPTTTPATTIAPTTTVTPTTVTPLTTPPPLYIPVPVPYSPPVYEPPSYRPPSNNDIWGYYPLASYIQNSVYLHSTTNLTGADLDRVYVSQDLGVICSAQGQEVTQYEDSTQWGYVQSPDGVLGWVADQFINVDGPAVPACYDAS